MKKFNKSFLKDKILPILLISIVIIIMFVSIGDLGELIEQTTGKNKIKDLGLVTNCNPSIALCSISSDINGKKIRLSLTIGEKIYQKKQFPFNLSISGLAVNQITSIYVSLELPGIEIKDNKQYLKIASKDKTNLNMHWLAKLKIPQIIKDRKDWLAIVHINLANQTQKTQQLVLTYQLSPMDGH